MPSDGNDGTATGKQYTQDLFEAEALQFVRDHADKPFFLYLPFTVPHLALQVPEDSLAEYKDKFPETPYTGKTYQHQPTPRAAYAAMVTRMDRTVGRVMDLLKELKLDRDTLVLFSSDNGAIDAYAGTDAKFFGALGDLRGMKGSLYEGGIRVPLLARAGPHQAGTTTDLPVAFWERCRPCARPGSRLRAASTGEYPPNATATGDQARHEFLYWEFPSYRGQQAVIAGDWKAVRQQLQAGKAKTELYNLKADEAESKDVAAANPEVVKRLEALMAREHAPSTLFPLPAIDPAKK